MKAAIVSVAAAVGFMMSVSVQAEPADPADPYGGAIMTFTDHVKFLPKHNSNATSSTPKNFAGTGPQATLVYYGGKVISNVKIQIVNWGNGVVDASMFPGFYTAFTNSAYMDWLTEYNTPTQTIGRGTYLGTYTDTSSATTKKAVTDAQIQSELAKLIAAGSVPTNDDNTLYMVHFPPGYNITQGTSASCQDFCAYHGTFQRNLNNVYYGVMPDFGGNCASGCGSHDQFGNTCSAATHETIEAITDAEVGLATNSLGPPLAWYDSDNGEIGDICASDPDGMIGSYVVQSEWSNEEGACIVTKASTTTNDFTVAVGPSSRSIDAGDSTTYTITTTSVSGTPPSIALTASGLPTGVTASFSPATVTAGASSTLTLTAAPSAAAANAVTFTVTGTAGTNVHTATSTLTVTASSGDFGLTISPGSATVDQGNSAFVTVDTSVVSGAPLNIALTVAGLPPGVTATFSPSPVAPGSTSVLTFTATASAPTGTATVTVTGTNSATHTATVSLTVVAGEPLNAGPDAGPGHGGGSESGDSGGGCSISGGSAGAGGLAVLFVFGLVGVVAVSRRRRS